MYKDFQKVSELVTELNMISLVNSVLFKVTGTKIRHKKLSVTALQVSSINKLIEGITK